jgi:hypothetical protein
LGWKSGWKMSGVVFVVLFIIFLNRRRGRPMSLPPQSGIWLGKGVQLVVLLAVFNAFDTAGHILLSPAFILLFAPSFVLKRIVVPLGWPRFAYWAARCCGPVNSIRDSGAGAAFYGALVLMRKPRSTQAIDWLTQRANHARAVRGTGVVTAGLLAALRGDRHRARCLFLIADTLRPKLIPANVQVVARDWLVADAARIGDWREVIRLGRRGRSSLRRSYSLARIAERLVGDPKGRHDWLLWLCWMVAPRRRATLPLLRRALAVAPALKPAAAASSVGGELPDALDDLARVLEGRFVQDAQSLARCLRAVDGALDRPSTRALLEQRMLALGVRHDAEAIVAEFRKRLIDMLEPLIEESPRLADGQERGPLLDQAVDRTRARLFRDIEAQCRDYRERLTRKDSMGAIPEWEAWAVLRDSADRLLELAPASKHALFHTMYVPMCNFAVFQFDACKRASLAHQIFSWLRAHSQGDPSASQLLSKNMRATAA